jgi:hypothetical protein
MKPQPSRLFGLLLALFLCLLGCAHGKDFKQIENFPYDKALVYFYRPSSHAASGQNYSIKLIETELGKLRNGSYFAYLADPGRHTFYYDGRYGFAKVTLDLFAGETYYIRGQPGGFLGTRFKLEQVHPVIGRMEIVDCHQSQ